MRGDPQVRSRPPVLYPPIDAYDAGLIEVDGGHRIYWEMCGNPLGKPALFLHGGPGGGCSRDNRRLFDPARYRIVLFDQRGCGRSRPRACIEANTTAHLVADMETLRQALAIDRWLVLGGSWGATLALIYAQAHPQRVAALVLRGVFMARRAELRWLYHEGASSLFPEAWERFLAPIPESERGNLIAAYHARLASDDPAVELAAARAWCAWEDEIMTLLPTKGISRNHAGDIDLVALARIQTHYFVNGAFLEENQILARAYRLRHIPGVVVQGRYDCVTPARSAWDLQRAWPRAELQIVPDAGHASSEAGILRRIIAATDTIARA